ncbi:MAG TPA: rod-binding protein [Malonomonas sp.]
MANDIDTKQLLSQATAQTAKLRPGKGRDPQQLKGATQQFEAVFIQQMFKEMRNTVSDEGIIPRGSADEMYTQMQDAEAAKIMAERGGIGLAEMMLQELLKGSE